MIHKSVLLKEVIEGLNLSSESEGLILDGTFGAGGHSLGICQRYPKARIIALDQDQSFWPEIQKKVGQDCKISFHSENFRDLDKVLKKEKVEEIDGMILDLGLNSDQLESSGRGFSFLKNEPLLMNFKEKLTLQDLTAREIVNNWSEDSLASIINGYGEERFYRKIARGIVEAREMAKIETTFDLVKIIENSIPMRFRKNKLHCATRTFQALRIAVNDELNTLTLGLEKGFKFLKKGGRMLVISFHSLEDRIVKNFNRARAQEKQAVLIKKKPITPSLEELEENFRSRSAKLRVLEKV
jgi:16S rRNA (cytosine1402-N4)-methyltransferase